MAKKKKDPLAAAARQVVKDTTNKAVKQTAKPNVKKQQPKQSSRQNARQSAKDVSNIARNTMRNAGESTKKATVSTAKALPKKKAKPFKASDISGNTGRGVTKQARKQTRSAYTGASQRKAQAKQKEKDIKAGKYNVPNRLSQADEMMLSQEGKNQVNYYKDQWEKAKARGDKAGMQKAHEEAEKVRLTNPATVKTTTYEGPTQSQVTMAALQQYAQAMQAGDEEGMRQAKNLAAYAMLNLPKDKRDQSYMTGAYSGGTWGDRYLEASESDILKNQGKNILKSEGAAFASAVPEAAGGYIETVMNAPDMNGGSSQLVVKDENVDKRKASQFDLRGQSRYTEEDARAKADHYQAQAEYLKQIAYATTPLPGVVGKFAVDATAAAGGMGIDLAANTIIPGSGLISMGARTWGSSVQQAKDYQKVNGTDKDPYADAKAYLYGTAIAGTEVLSEKMFGGPWSKIYGRGFADAAVKGATKPTIGKTILKGMLEEGSEELAADLVQWKMPAIYGGDVETLPEMLKGAAYDFTLGAALGGLGGAVTAPGQVRQQKLDNLKKRAKATGLSDEDVDRVFKGMTVGELELLTDATDGTLSDWIAGKQSGEGGNNALDHAAKESYGTGLSEKPVQLRLKAKQDRLDAIGMRMKKLGLENSDITPVTTGFAKKKYDNELIRVTEMDDSEFMDWLSTQGINSSQIENQSLTGASGEQSSEQTFEAEAPREEISRGKAWNALRSRLRESGVRDAQMLRTIRDRMSAEEMEEAANLRKNDFLEWRDRVTSPDYQPAPREEAPEPTENITAEELNAEEEDELSTISSAQINKLGDKLREFGVDSRAVARAISNDSVLEDLVNMDADELRTWAEEQKAPAKPSNEEVSEMLREQEEMLAERREREPKANAEPLTGDAALVNAMADYLGDAGRSTMISHYDPKNIKDASRYVLETRLAYNAGFTGNQISRTMNRVISPETANRMYEAGVMDKQAVHEQRRRKQARAKFYNSNEAGLGRDANGHYLDEYVENLARQSKENAMILDEIDRTSKAFGAKVLFPDAIAVRNKEGKATETAGGGYTQANIMLDKDLGKALEYTYGHELTHRMAEIDPKAYELFKKYVMSRPDSEKMYTELQYEYNRREIEADHDLLVEETCAEFSGAMISQADMLRDFARMADQNVVQRFFQALRDMARKLTGREKAYVERAVKVLDDAYRERYGVSMSREMKEKTTADVKAVGEMYESSMKQARKMSKNAPASSVIEGDVFLDNENNIQYSVRAATHDIEEGEMLEDLVNAGIMTRKEAERVIQDVKDVIEYMLPFADIVDWGEEYTMESRPFSPIKPNSDPLYVLSIDFSTNCRKRLVAGAVIERLQVEAQRALSAEDQIKIRDLLAKYREMETGFQIACAFCYVESARLKTPEYVNEFLDNKEAVFRNYFAQKSKSFKAGYDKMVGDYKESKGKSRTSPDKELPQKQRDELTEMKKAYRQNYKLTPHEQQLLNKAINMPAEAFLTEKGLTNLVVKEPEIYDVFINKVRSASHAKPLESYVPMYYGDIAKNVSRGMISKFNDENGFRTQSWSDWQVQNMLDEMVAVIELSILGGKMLKYTKFPEVARIFGGTGIMFNMSGVVMATKPIYDEDGEYSIENFDVDEGVNILEALEVRDMYPDTVGIQCIGNTIEQTKALLRTDWVDYVIPYHKSGMSEERRKAIGIDGWHDHEDTQQAKPIDAKAKPGPKDDAKNWHKEPKFSEIMAWNGKDGLDCMRKTQKKYLKMCKERGLTPAFPEYVDEPNYWKLLIERKMINHKTGKIIRQQPVRPIFNKKEAFKAIDREVREYDPTRVERAYRYVKDHLDEVGVDVTPKMKEQAAVQGNTLLANFVNEPPVLYSIKRTKRQEKRDNGEKLTESQFYGLYSAHIIAGGRQADDPVTERTVEGIKTDGFKGDGGPFGANVLPASSSSTVRGYTVEELKAQGKGESTIKDLKENPGAYGATWIGDRLYYNLNDTMRRYGARKGQAVLLVPESDVDKNDKIRTGFKPFDYEIVTVERDFQPYYELYSKAYDKYQEQNVKYSLRGSREFNDTVVLEESTVDKYLQDYAAPSSPNYAQAYIVHMSPRQFLDLTTSITGRAAVEREATDLDLDQLANATRFQPFQLRINHETGEVYGHEGRHRMEALRRNNVYAVPVLLFDSSNKSSKEFMDSLTLTGQDFGSTRSLAMTTVHGVLPLSYANRDEIIKRFATQPTDERIAENYGKETVRYSLRARDSEYLQAVRDGDMETAQRLVDEAAKEAGYTIKAYHGTANGGKFTIFDPKKLNNSKMSSHIGQGFYFTNSREGAKEYTKNMDAYGKVTKGSNPYLFEGYIRLQNPIKITNNSHVLTLKQIRNIVSDGNKKWFFESGMAHVLQNKDIGGESYTKDDIKAMDTEKRIDLYSRYLYRFGDMAALSNMVDAYTFDSQDALLLSIQYHTGYDGIHWEQKEGLDQFVVFDSSQFKDSSPVTYDDEGNIIPLSKRFNPDNPDIRWALRGGRTVEELAAAYGIIPPGEKRAREVRVPQQTEDDNRVSRAIRTIMEAQTTPEQLLPRIEEMIANGEFSYSPITNKESVAKARATINELGYDEAWRKWSNDIDDRKASSDVVTLGWILYDDALKDGNTDKALEICAKMARFGSQLGQAVQALSILKRLPTELQMRMIPQPRPKHVQDKIDEYEEEEDDDEFDPLAPDEYDEDTGLPKPKKPRKPREKKKPTQEEVDQMEEDTAKYQIEHSKITLKDKWDAWRYLAMLANFRTHIRNIVGNLGFAPIIITKNLTATVSEIALYNTFGKSRGMQRTKGFYGLSQFHYAWNDFTEMRPIIMGEAKWEGQESKPDKIVFRGILAPIEKLRNFNGSVLDKEDALFSRPQYANALAQFMAANGITVEMMETGVGRIEKGPHKDEEFNGGIMQEARAYAVKEAQKATYRDLNNISKLFMQLGKVKDPKNRAERFTNILVEGIFPFRKTPANILCRSVEYSPAGFVNGIWKLTWGVWNTCRIQEKVSRGEKLKDWEMEFKPVTVAEALDRLCSGLSGTGIFILGMYLAKMGLLVAKSDDGDDNQYYFDKLLGHQQWALEIFDYSVTIDWLAPEVVPLFMGAQYFTSMSSGNPIRNVSNMLDSATMILDPVMELSCLSGIQETLNNTAKFAEGDLNTMTSLIASMGLSYLTQGVPTLFGQLERVSQADRMQTFATENPDAMFSEDWQYQIGKISAKIPGRDYQQVPYIDSWGNTETETSMFKRIVANMFNPAYIKKIDTREVNKELQRLYDVTGDGYVFPKPVWKSYNFKDENGVAQTYYLTEEEWVATSRAKGRESFDLVQKFMNSKAYKEMSDPDRADMISDLYSYADYKASKAYIHNYRKELSSATKWIEKYETFSNAIGGYDVLDYKLLDRKVHDVTGVKLNASDSSKPYTTACAKLIAVYDSGAKIPSDPAKRDAMMEALDISPKVRSWTRDAAKEFNDKEWRKLGVEPPA